NWVSEDFPNPQDVEQLPHLSPLILSSFPLTE
ncbi:unnamed protein product, partial [marine sediment metagenome]